MARMKGSHGGNQHERGREAGAKALGLAGAAERFQRRLGCHERVDKTRMAGRRMPRFFRITLEVSRPRWFDLGPKTAAPVAQLDRASDYGSEGFKFES